MLNKLFNSISFSPVFLSAKTHLERGEGFSLELNNSSHLRVRFFFLFFLKRYLGPLRLSVKTKKALRLFLLIVLACLVVMFFAFQIIKKTRLRSPVLFLVTAFFLRNLLVRYCLRNPACLSLRLVQQNVSQLLPGTTTRILSSVWSALGCQWMLF